MGVKLELYRARIGSFLARKPKVRASQEEEGEGACWFLGLILMVILVIGGVEPNPGPHSEQDKLDKILANLRNQEFESKATQKLFEIHKGTNVSERRASFVFRIEQSPSTRTIF
jgi:hypothetical protein